MYSKNDILVYSRSRDDHAVHLSAVLQALSDVQLKINAEKSGFFCQTVVFLGRRFDGKTEYQGRKRAANQVSCEASWRSFPSCIFRPRRTLQKICKRVYAKKTKCITTLTQKGVPFIWSDECEQTYLNLVTTISSDPAFELYTDASHYGTGAVFYQRDDK